jgi:CIC family chloride channel protein
VGLLLSESKIDSHVTNEYMTLDIDTSSHIAAKALAVRGYSEGYCLTTTGNFIGKIKLQDLVNSPEKNTLEDLLNKNPTSINLGTSIENAREIASTFIGEAIPVINKDTNEMIGVVSEADIFTAVLDIQNSVTVLEKN